MFLHLGQDVLIPLSEVIGIVNLCKSDSEVNREFLRTAEEEGFVIQLSKKPISCILTPTNIYLSPISVRTLKKRAGRNYLKSEI